VAFQQTLNDDSVAKPFLKWAGGKRDLVSELRKHIPDDAETYFEPFFGGGALFFALQPENGLISDFNEELMLTYLMIRDNVGDVISVLKDHASNHDEDYYYEVREQHYQSDPVEKAARLIYLNRTCFNGLYRKNQKGEFNVPIGSYDNPPIVRESVLQAASKALQNTTIAFGDFAKIEPKEKDFVYLDPPYHSNDNGFTSYTGDGFSEDDQRRVKKFAEAMRDQGVYVMISNSGTNFIQTLYSGDEFTLHPVNTTRSVSGEAKGREVVEELIITTY
jgi:DNA adenine methylase